MATNIEIEAKVLINEQDYNKIRNIYMSQATNSYVQTNYYIDTVDNKLKAVGIGLRIREHDGKYVITSKTPLSEGLLEKTATISKQEYENMSKNNVFPETEIKNFLISLGVKIQDLRILTSLTTERIDISEENGLFSIDKNTYSGIVDYELEKEDNNLQAAEDFLINICEKNHINYEINNISKSKRAFNALKK